MGRLRVRSAALQLRLPDDAKDAATRLAGVLQQRFIPSVLDGLRQELDSACGNEAVIRIPKLRLRLRISPNETDGRRLAHQVARDLAEEVRASLTSSKSGRTFETAGAVAQSWPDKPAFYVTALVSAAQGEPSPIGPLESASDVVKKLTAEEPSVVGETLVRVDELANLPEVLASLPTTMVQAMFDRVAPLLPRHVASQFHKRLKMTEPRRPPTKQNSAEASSVPFEPKTSRNEDTDAPLDDTVPLENDAHPETGHPSEAEDPPQENPMDPIDIDTPASQVVESNPEQPRVSNAVERAEAKPLAGIEPEIQETFEASPPQPFEAKTDDPPASEIASYKTNFGLFPSLLNVALRLELPERLWQIGVPEGAALSAMAGVITGDPSDPMVGILSPEHPNPPPPIVALPSWARDEIVAAIVQNAGEITEGAVTASMVEMRRMSLAEDSEWRLAEWGAATLLSVTEALLDGDEQSDLFARLRVPGDIEVMPEEIAVRLPLSAIDLDLRRAGLDRDPGWLGWLQRRMTLHFGSDDEDWSI